MSQLPYLKQQAAQLLASGLPEVEVANRLAVTPSYLSQLKRDDGFMDYYESLVSGQKVATHSTVTKIDNHYNSLELKYAELLDANSDAILPALMKSPSTLLAALRTINSLKRRAVGEGSNNGSNTAQVQLMLPGFMLAASTPVVQHNQHNEVIEVDGRSLVSLSGTGVKSQLAKLQQEAALERIGQEQGDHSPANSASLSHSSAQHKLAAPESTRVSSQIASALADLASDGELDLSAL